MFSVQLPSPYVRMENADAVKNFHNVNIYIYKRKYVQCIINNKGIYDFIFISYWTEYNQEMLKITLF